MNAPNVTPVRLMVVDDHTLFRRGLVALLASDASLAVVGEASDAGEARAPGDAAAAGRDPAGQPPARRHRGPGAAGLEGSRAAGARSSCSP